MPLGGGSRAEVGEVEGEDGELMALGYGHHRRIGEPEIQVGVLPVDLDGAPKEAGRHVGDLMLAVSKRGDEDASRLGSDSRAQHVLDLGHDRHRHQQIPTQH